MKSPDSPPRILVVDDDNDVRQALHDQLVWAGHPVTAVSTADEALRQLRSDSFAVVISDQRMPDMTGLELLTVAKELQPFASRILITGVASLDTAVDAINLGEISRFITKPWLQAELLVTISNEVQRSRLLETNKRLQAETVELNRRLAATNSDLEAKLRELESQRADLDLAHGALKKNFDHSLELCYRMMSTFYPVLGRHTQSVVDLCRRMAETGHLSGEEQHVLLTAAWLHDIGLIGVERDVLHRMYRDPGSLSGADRTLIRNHPIYGQTLAGFVDELRAVGETIRCHHERFDGQGYPDGRAGEAIPWTARCLAVVVAFTDSDLPHNDALELILAGSGKAFDPEAVRLFFKSAQPSVLPRKVREILIDELRPGMLLAKGIYSPTGMLLVPEGQSLSEHTISKLRNHHLSASITHRLLVYS